MKKIVKKIISLSMCICMMMAFTVGASAAGPATTWGSPANAVYWKNNAYPNAYLNAYANTPSQVTEGTLVTCYTKSNDNTQRFYTQTGYLKNASRTDLVVKEITSPYGEEDIVVLSSNLSGANLSFHSYGSGYMIRNSTNNVLVYTGTITSSDTVYFIPEDSSIIANYVWTLQ